VQVEAEVWAVKPEVVLEQFVGREEELAALNECFERAASGRPTLVAVSGEVGIGKSRLVREALSAIEPKARAIGVGHCLEHLKTPFLPFGEIVRGLKLDLGFDLQQETEPAARGRVQTEKHLRRLQMVAHALLNASGRPFVVVVEDVHWADAATLGLLEHLAVSGTHGRLLIILTLRSEAVERAGAFARVLSKLRGAGLISVRLAPLKPTEITTLLRSAVQTQLPRATVERIKSLAEGNPLFAEELLRAALDDNVLHPAYASIRATVIDRLYQLSESDQRVIVCASVVGRFFDPNLVAALAERSFDDTIAALRRARNLQLIREARDPGTSHTLAFRHSLFSEVVYQELLEVEARSLHARVASLILNLSKDQKTSRIAEIAYHYTAADDTKKALKYNAEAGDEAMRLTAFEDAAGFYEQALRYLQLGTAQYAELTEKRAYAWYAAGLAENTAGLFSDALAAYEAQGDRQKVVEMLLFLSRQAWNDAETPDGYHHAIRAADLIGDRDPALREYAMTMAASYAVHLGQLEEAERIVASLDATNPDIAARLIDTRAMLCARKGQINEALRLCAQAQIFAEQTADPDVLVRVYSNSADITALCGQREQAAELWHKAYSAAQAGGYIGRMAYAALGYAAALIECGQLEKARDLYRLALETGVSNASVTIQAAAVGALLNALLGIETSAFIKEEAAFELVLRSKESLRIGQLGGALAFNRLAHRESTQLQRILARAIGELESPVFAEMLLLLGAARGDVATKSRARDLLHRTTEVADLPVLALCRRVVEAIDSGGTVLRSRLESIADSWAQMRCHVPQIVTLELTEDDSKIRNALESIRAAGYAGRLRGLDSRSTVSTARLTPRELEVARLLADAESNRSIAERLGISERTVEHHVESILSRLGVRSRWLVTADLIARV
jgi:predicted ATPase/DNA-binding CsgD family transcriptional regulator